MEQRLSLVTLGVSDLSRARAFYEALGWRSPLPPDSDVVFFQTGGMVLALWGQQELEADSGYAPSVSSGGHSPESAPTGTVTLAHNVRSEAEVDEVLAQAGAAGARVVREGTATFWGGYSGAFHDPDGHAWEVAYNPGWPLRPDGSVQLPS